MASFTYHITISSTYSTTYYDLCDTNDFVEHWTTPTLQLIPFSHGACESQGKGN